MEQKVLISSFKSACFYDALTNTWNRLKSMSISGDVFFCVDYEECTPDPDEFEVFILPGFIDAHCHIQENPYTVSDCKENTGNECYETLLHNAQKNVITAAHGGVTTLKDLGGYEYSSVDIAEQITEIPIRVLTSGCYFTCPDGHASDHGAIIIESIGDFERGVSKLQSKSIQYCKILHSDNGFTYDFLSRMINLAHEKGMLVSCHVFTEKAAQDAVLAGADILEHAGDYSDGLLQQIKDKDLIVVPTYVAATDSTPENCEMLGDINEVVLKQWLDGEKAVIPRLFANGINVALGTDSGFPGTPCNSLAREIQLLHRDFGIPIEQLLHSAFIVTPRTIRMHDRLGRIATGYLSDFQCYKRNPLAHVGDLGYPYEVWACGKKIETMIIDSVTIRRLKEPNIQDIILYLHNYFFDCGTLNDAWSDEEISSWIRNENDYCSGAFYENEIIGFCLTHYHKQANKVHLENIYVSERYRMRGVANKLLSDAVRHYMRRAPSQLRFVALIDCTNIPSINLLNKCQFMKGHSMYWMQRNICNDDKGISRMASK